MKNEKTKKLIVDVVKVLAFVLAFFVVLEIFSNTIFSSEKSGIVSGRLADAYSFTENDPNTIDVVCLGDSDLYSGFVPTALWDSFGYTSTACASPHQTFSECELILDTLLETQSPKIVIVESDMLYDGRYVDDTRLVDENSLLKNISQFISDYVTPDKFEDDIETLFPVFMFHNQWKDMDRDKKNHEYSQGYIYNNTVKSIDSFADDFATNMAYTDERDYPVYEKDNDCRNFVSYCQEKGLKVILCEVPTLNAWTYARHNAVSDMCKELGVDFVDINVMFDELGLDPTTCFRDKGNHINYDSAVKVTNCLGQFMYDNNYGLTDHRNDSSYSDIWNNYSANFKKHNKIDDD